MPLRSFKEWKQFNESQKGETKCPRPKDKEFCRKWKLYLDGKGKNPMQENKTKKSIGPNTTRSSTMTTEKEKQRFPELGRGGRQGSKNRLTNDID